MCAHIRLPHFCAFSAHISALSRCPALFLCRGALFTVSQPLRVLLTVSLPALLTVLTVSTGGSELTVLTVSTGTPTAFDVIQYTSLRKEL